ncbi:hypothetical protein HK100_011302 [Physocladia obscura]|uniref:Crinkler (CRN) family protein n=1 Tax=Physocladia obscura TaxID=109957 RepID=A0AAD5T4C9_9FUNG|nr:hypothetical protein HK100_011302 [Physocladia obscura]
MEVQTAVDGVQAARESVQAADNVVKRAQSDLDKWKEKNVDWTGEEKALISRIAALEKATEALKNAREYHLKLKEKEKEANVRAESQSPKKRPLASDDEILVMVTKRRRSISLPLVQTAGSAFLFSDRDESFRILADALQERYSCWQAEKQDRNLHPIPFLADGPGSGKSRFLQELSVSFKSYVTNSIVLSHDFKVLLSNALFINITFGNGSAYTNDEVAIGIQKSLCLRILYQFNRKLYPSFGVFYTSFKDSDWNLAVTLASISPSEFGCIVLGIDEVNQVHDIDKEQFKQLFRIVGGLSCSFSLFFVPILAGTVIGPMQSVVTKSTHPPLHIPLPLLSFKSCVTIIIARDEHYATAARENKYLRQLISDVGGHCRSLELLYQALISNTYNPNLKSFWDDVATNVRMNIISRYGIGNIPDFGKAIAYAFLSILVDDNQPLSGLNSGSFVSLEEIGVIKLVPRNGRKIVRIPFMFVWSYLQTNHYDSFAKFWNEILLSKVLQWQEWEDFNINYIAFRLSLFSCLGYKSIQLSKFLSGATHNFSNDPVIAIPNIENIEVSRRSERYPETSKNPPVSSGNCVLNAGGSSFDGFVYLDEEFLWLNELTGLQSSRKTKFLLALQMKLSYSNGGQEISNESIAAEYKKVRLCMDTYLPNISFALLVLGRCKGKFDSKIRENCAVVSKAEQKEFYGEAYYQRLNFVFGFEEV